MNRAILNQKTVNLFPSIKQNKILYSTHINVGFFAMTLYSKQFAFESLKIDRRKKQKQKKEKQASNKL